MTSNSVVGSGYGRVAMLFAMLLRCVVATHRRNSTSATTIGCVNQVATLQSIEMGNPTYLRRCKATCDGERWVLCNSLHDAMGKMRSNKSLHDGNQRASSEPNCNEHRRNPTVALHRLVQIQHRSRIHVLSNINFFLRSTHDVTEYRRTL